MIGIVIQARMGSSRLPGKVLKKINDMTILEYQLDRIKGSKRHQKIIVATSSNKIDDPIELLCKKKKISYFRGSEEDVLARYYECAKFFELDTIVRLTADCPFSDPDIIDDVIDHFYKNNSDYCSNTVPPETSTWPDGSDVEVFSFHALERAHFESISSEEREHVTFFFWKNKKNNFKISQLKNAYDWSDYRFTIDYPEDYKASLLLHDEIETRNIFGHLAEIISILKDRPDIKNLNEKYYFGVGWNQ